MKKSFCLIFILAVSATSGCSRFSSNARQERAYAKYVKKSKIERDRRQAEFRKEKAKVPAPGTETSEPQEMTQASTSEGPQAVPSDLASQ